MRFLLTLLMSIMLLLILTCQSWAAPRRIVAASSCANGQCGVTLGGIQTSYVIQQPNAVLSQQMIRPQSGFWQIAPPVKYWDSRDNVQVQVQPQQMFIPQQTFQQSGNFTVTNSRRPLLRLRIR